MKKNIMIIGAGFAGRTIAGEIREKGVLGKVVGFLDDNPEKIGTTIDGLPVFGPIKKAKQIRESHPSDEALIAIPSADRKKLSEIYSTLKKAGFMKIRILPSISQIVDGDAHFIQIREIGAQDFLGRNPVIISLKESLSYLRGKRVVITGAGGSIGSELCRQLLSGGAERLYLFGHGENSIYEIARELKILQEEGVGEKATIVPVIGELQDRNFVRFIMKRLRADVVFHCAAYKHVPLLEENPVEAVKNNVFGTKNLVEAAIEAGTSRFVFISTDKAVEPCSVYGASKAVAEKVVLNGNHNHNGFMVVRFGNVLGSRGSIVPLFRKQILKGGPVTITHPEISRYFMTIPEAASLVLKAGGVGEGGNLYILDMGEPIKIRELAEQMIKFHGFAPYREIPITYVGLRPGEKLHEKLRTDEDTLEKTEHPSINRLLSNDDASKWIDTLVDGLKPICYFDPQAPEHYRNRKKLRKILRTYIPTLESSENEPEY
jgi:FlaA1/EpsC-like NDP-sugar epimerase